MRPLISEQKHKFFIILVTALTSLFTLEAMNQALIAYQSKNFALIAAAGYGFLVFLQSFVFDLELKEPWQSLRHRFRYMANKQHWLNYQNYLILPAIIYWSSVILIYLNASGFQQEFRQILILASTLSLTVAFWYMKTVFYSHKEGNKIARQALFIAKLYATYLAFAAAFQFVRFYGYGVSIFMVLIFSITWLLVYQAFFQHHHLDERSFKFLLAFAALLGLCASLVYTFWNVNFFSGALVLSAIYTTLWGLLHHGLIDKNLNQKIAYEYLSVLFVILVIVISTTNFAERI